jgi:hypothetical protein
VRVAFVADNPGDWMLHPCHGAPGRRTDDDHPRELNQEEWT